MARQARVPATGRFAEAGDFRDTGRFWGSHHSADPGDDYLVALAEHRSAVFVSGDQHLLALALAQELPILAPREFLEQLDARTPNR